jgi:hypothetical protein
MFRSKIPHLRTNALSQIPYNHIHPVPFDVLLPRELQVPSLTFCDGRLISVAVGKFARLTTEPTAFCSSLLLTGQGEIEHK